MVPQPLPPPRELAGAAELDRLLCRLAGGTRSIRNSCSSSGRMNSGHSCHYDSSRMRRAGRGGGPGQATRHPDCGQSEPTHPPPEGVPPATPTSVRRAHRAEGRGLAGHDDRLTELNWLASEGLVPRSPTAAVVMVPSSSSALLIFPHAALRLEAGGQVGHLSSDRRGRGEGRPGVEGIRSAGADHGTRARALP
jgi:hypothetical protein